MGGRSGFAGYGVALSALIACGFTAPAFAQAPSAAPAAPAPDAAAPAAAAAATTPGDPHRGKELSYTCLGCHGIDGYRNAYPDYSVPKLEGQNPEYLIAA
ncbi:MAG: hypothetical protein JOY74_02370, partial [Sinobacteraceae bacterium]|nr:hypothetical protein [Nevskiaceae bacterium]